MGRQLRHENLAHSLPLCRKGFWVRVPKPCGGRSCSRCVTKSCPNCFRPQTNLKNPSTTRSGFQRRGFINGGRRGRSRGHGASEVDSTEEEPAEGALGNIEVIGTVLTQQKKTTGSTPGNELKKGTTQHPQKMLSTDAGASTRARFKDLTIIQDVRHLVMMFLQTRGRFDEVL